jgi:hypothetical protein
LGESSWQEADKAHADGAHIAAAPVKAFHSPLDLADRLLIADPDSDFDDQRFSIDHQMHQMQYGDCESRVSSEVGVWILRGKIDTDD